MHPVDIPLTQTVARVLNPGPDARFVLEDGHPVSDPSAGKVLVKVQVAGLCHSDLNRVYGKLPLISSIVGHEGVGTVVKVGSEAASHLLSKRVGLGWLSLACLKCEVCDIEYTSCPNQQNLGRDLSGTFQQYVVVDAGFVHPLPNELQAEMAAPLLCAGVSMYSAIRKCNLQPNSWLLIPGAGGGLGHLGVQIARAQGYRVIAIDTGEDKKQICLDFGATHFIDFQEQDVPVEVGRITNLGVHGVICTAGSASAYHQAAQCVRNAGTIVCVGVNTQDLPISPLDMVRTGLRLIGTAVGTRVEMQQVFQLAAQGKVKPLVTVVPFDQIDSVARKLENGELEDFKYGTSIILAAELAYPQLPPASATSLCGMMSTSITPGLASVPMPSDDAPLGSEEHASPVVQAYSPRPGDNPATLEQTVGEGIATCSEPQVQNSHPNQCENANHSSVAQKGSLLQAQGPAEARQSGTSRPNKQRAKRGKYIAKACNECKRRKSKCNGQQPCGRCVQHSLDCVYAPSSAASRTAASSQTIQSLSEQVAQLQGNIQELREEPQRVYTLSTSQGNKAGPPSISPRRPISSHTIPTSNQGELSDPAIHTHTTPPSIAPSSVNQSRQPTINYTFNLELARQHLRTQRVRTGDVESADATRSVDCTRQGSPAATPSSWEFSTSTIDPLWLIDKQEALRLCHVYEEEIGISYPFLSLPDLTDKAHNLYDAMGVASRCGFAFSSLPGPTVIERDDVGILRLAFSTALIIETSGASELGNSLFAKAQENASSKVWEPTTFKSIALFTLMAIHSFLSGDDLQAWRLIGIPARWCLELGLHQAAAYNTKFKHLAERKMVARLFWSIHTLDRRWSFGAGLPFVIQSDDIDPNIPMPDDEVPYLQAMVAYNRIGAKVWATLYNSRSAASTASADDIDFLHYSIDRWYRDIPVEMRLHQGATSAGAPRSNRGLHRLQMLLYLRSCQMKILLHQSVLHSVPRLSTDGSQVRMIVDIAKDMIQKLDHLNKTTNIYQTQQVCFNHFLVSALGVVFLAVALEPAVYRNVVRHEFNMALDLVRGFSKRSYVSRRLWSMIGGLRQAGVRLGISGQHPEEGGSQVDHQPSPLNTASMPTPPVLASPSSQSGPSQVSDACLGSDIANDRGDGFIMPISGSQMTLTLNDLLVAMENEDTIWAPSLDSSTNEPMPGTQNKDMERHSDHAADFSWIDFSPMWDSFL